MPTAEGSSGGEAPLTIVGFGKTVQVHMHAPADQLPRQGQSFLCIGYLDILWLNIPESKLHILLLGPPRIVHSLLLINCLEKVEPSCRLRCAAHLQI